MNTETKYSFIVDEDTIKAIIPLPFIMQLVTLSKTVK